MSGIDDNQCLCLVTLIRKIMIGIHDPQYLYLVSMIHNICLLPILMSDIHDAQYLYQHSWYKHFMSGIIENFVFPYLIIDDMEPLVYLSQPSPEICEQYRHIIEKTIYSYIDH